MSEVELECAVYGEGTVFPVKIASDAKVSALQEAIFYKKRYNERANIDASMLTLYVAKKKEGEEDKWLKDDDNLDVLLSGKPDTSYEKMRSSWRLNKDELLGPNFKPGDEEIHVLVELKEELLGSAKRQKTEAIDHKEFNELFAVAESFDGIEVGTILSTPEEIFEVSFEKGLYIRQEYLDLYNMINHKMELDQSINRILVLGSPGIGKSVFGIVLLLLFITNKWNIAYRPLSRSVIYYFNWNTTGYEISITPRPGMTYMGLFDGKEGEDGALYSRVHNPAFLFASPRTTNYNEFVKKKCFKVYMNPWNKVECQRLANAIHADEDEWLRRYNLVGGKPRFLFSSSIHLDVLVARVESDIPHSVIELKEQVRLYEKDVFDDRMKHIVFNLYRDDSIPSLSYLTYSSLVVEVIMNARFNIESANEIRSLLQTPAPNLQAWRGKQIEKFLLQDLATSIFSVKSLEGRALGTVRQLGPFNANSRTIQAASEIGKELMLYIPISKTFPAVDGILVVPRARRVIYAQATVSTAHPIKYPLLKNIYENLTKRIEFQGFTHTLLFIVSNDIFDSFRYQPYKNADGKQDRKAKVDIKVKQFVGRVDSIY